jgi:hypothetical protein
MTPIEQAKAALEFIQHLHSCEDEGMASGQPSKEDYLKAREITDDALSALSTIEGSGEPVALSALMEAVAEGMNTADDRNDEPMSWIQSCLQRIKGVSDMTDAERLPILKLKPSPSLSVDEVEQVVKEWCFNWCERVTPDQSDWADLRERLTKAITRS